MFETFAKMSFVVVAKSSDAWSLGSRMVKQDEKSRE